MAENKDLVEIKSTDYVSIKSTPKEARELQNRRIVDRVNRIEAKRRQQAAVQRHIEPHHRTPHGEVICGSLNEAEKRAIQSGDDVTLRRVALLRLRAIQLERQKKWGDKVTSYEALARLQGRSRKV